jgi:hypothetical protein
MSATHAHSYTERSTSESGYSVAAVGITLFASVLMIMTGIMQAIQGLVALVDDTFFVVGKEYMFKFDVTSWGWAHLIFGVVVALAGFALLTGATWARVVVIILASVAIVVNFVWMPYYPLWSITLLALNVAIIWAATMHGRDIASD